MKEIGEVIEKHGGWPKAFANIGADSQELGGIDVGRHAD